MKRLFVVTCGGFNQHGVVPREAAVYQRFLREFFWCGNDFAPITGMGARHVEVRMLLRLPFGSKNPELGTSDPPGTLTDTEAANRLQHLFLIAPPKAVMIADAEVLSATGFSKAQPLSVYEVTVDNGQITFRPLAEKGRILKYKPASAPRAARR